MLVTVLRDAVAASTRPDGWAPLTAVGSAVKQISPIHPRNYGAKNLSALFDATGQFETFKLGPGMAYVADKRKKDRKSKPDR